VSGLNGNGHADGQVRQSWTSSAFCFTRHTHRWSPLNRRRSSHEDHFARHFHRGRHNSITKASAQRRVGIVRFKSEN
jgi:hypothetical protein